MGGNPQIVVPDHLALRFQVGTNPSVGISRGFRHRKCRQQADKFAQSLEGCKPLMALGGAVQQFSISDDRKCRFSRPEPLESAQYLPWSFLPNIDADIRVQ